ncbi:hypothetical protein HHL19_11165 [Streptomyces sp. R302]|uniref:hypothetical protein n=1 Tax=unclassified Streptomyces TaxID=2593676 RepID=UPI00145CD88D|nr:MULTISPECIES: hypothetical protein [unclassified Streptomyces]NML50222.1 hypothetical protein [Streptomyces sp. R301]NML79213.1 hypothetical protein [Streptomyces sp. R302]
MKDDDTTTLRDALERAAEELPPLPDLVPVAVREGRRRRARARFATAATAFGVVTAGALGLTLLPGGGPAPAMPAAPPSSPGTSAGPGAGYPPVVVEETPGVTPPDNPDGLSPAERERRAVHQQRVAALLDELLPAKVTEIRPVKDEVAVYRITADGKPFRMVVSVRPTDDEALKECPNLPEHKVVCEAVTFDGDREADLLSMPVNQPGTFASYVNFLYGGSRVQLGVEPDDVTSPLTPRQLLAVAEDPRFLDLVEAADAQPMETKAPPAVKGG